MKRIVRSVTTPILLLSVPSTRAYAMKQVDVQVGPVGVDILSVPSTRAYAMKLISSRPCAKAGILSVPSTRAYAMEHP